MTCDTTGLEATGNECCLVGTKARSGKCAARLQLCLDLHLHSFLPLRPVTPAGRTAAPGAPPWILTGGLALLLVIQSQSHLVREALLAHSVGVCLTAHP